MGLKTFKPYTKSTRGTILVNRDNLWKGKPYKPLTSSKKASSPEITKTTAKKSTKVKKVSKK